MVTRSIDPQNTPQNNVGIRNVKTFFDRMRLRIPFGSYSERRLSDFSLVDTQAVHNKHLSRVQSSFVRGIRLFPGLEAARPSRRIQVALRGSAWIMVGYGGSQLLRLVSTLVLARHLLAPEAFGLVALVNVFLGGLDLLSDLGIGLDVVQHKRGDDPAFINTAFLIQAGRGVILWVIATALAYPFALFYHQPEVRLLATVGAFSVAVRGVASGSVWLMTRHVQLKKLTLLNVSGDAVGLIVSVAWAILSPTPWALVAGRLAMVLAFTIGSHWISENRVSLCWDKSAARDIFAFGVGIFLTSVTYFIGGEAERLIVGKFITIAELGCFSLALTLSAAPVSALGQVVGQVFFPMISQSVREDRETAARHFRKARFVFLAISIVLGVGFIAYSRRLVALLLPRQYESTGWMLQWLGFRAAQQVFASPTSSLILAYGDSRQGAVANTLRSILMVSGVWLGFTKYGSHIAIASLAIAYIAAYIALIPGLARHLRPVLRDELNSFGLFTLCMALATIIPWPWR
jgi:O-antigen/teichoic acid export membrane protein